MTKATVKMYITDSWRTIDINNVDRDVDWAIKRDIIIL
tara:strand:+ start:1153 stop:1266 length:114 start_codon:yes stop_codon:yes gene_type:complete